MIRTQSTFENNDYATDAKPALLVPCWHSLSCLQRSDKRNARKADYERLRKSAFLCVHDIINPSLQGQGKARLQRARGGRLGLVLRILACLPQNTLFGEALCVCEKESPPVTALHSMMWRCQMAGSMCS